MFGLILACALADTAQTVEAKTPTLATIRARFIVYLPLMDFYAAKSNAGVKANASDYRRAGSYWARLQTRAPPECVAVQREDFARAGSREPSPKGLGGLHQQKHPRCSECSSRNVRHEHC